MPPFDLPHIIIEGRTESLPYTSNQTGRNKVIPRTGLDRAVHGQAIREQFINAVNEYSEDGLDSDFVYVTFQSPANVLLDLAKFQVRNFRLASFKEHVTQNENGTILKSYEATVCINKRGISQFLKKLDDYLDPERDTPVRQRADGTQSGGNPANLSLIANIDSVRHATLRAFWREPEIPFPAEDENVWWEVWLHRENEGENPILAMAEIVNNAALAIGERYLQFPEHSVYLVRGTAIQLATSLLYTDRLSELRKPKETADFFTNLDIIDQANWSQDLVARTDYYAQDNGISVCLLDTGVTKANPLLTNLIPDHNLDTLMPAWSTMDTHGQGHGTPMAGLALYGDLADHLASQNRVAIFHQLESVKIIEHGHAHDPALYGWVTQEAVARREVANPNLKRVICMAVTSEATNHKGQPTSWSSAVDQMLFGSVDEPNERNIMFVSAGNIPAEERIQYPLINDDRSIHDPAQSFNAITVGAYTLKDSLDLATYPGAQILAPRGGISACSATSVTWDKEWCRKPDVVFEGGNQAVQNGGTIDPESLLLLTTSRGGLGRPWFTSFCDTSAATALASRFGAELYHRYRHLRPETIRGLIVHSADWTPAMLRNRNIAALSLPEKEKLIKLVGYGVPNLERAINSATNSLCLIAERELKPYKWESSKIKSNEFHLFDLPWPVDALQQLFNTAVRFKLTLSYFVEPYPAARDYDKAQSYRSHSLRFKMIDRDESLDSFKRRISADMRDDAPYTAEGGERNWILGEKIRNKGSIHKDIWEGPAADLATRNKIAIYPVGGWWKKLKKFARYDASIRYSLIMSIESEAEDVDLYTPVLNQIPIQV